MVLEKARDGEIRHPINTKIIGNKTIQRAENRKYGEKDSDRFLYKQLRRNTTTIHSKSRYIGISACESEW